MLVEEHSIFSSLILTTLARQFGVAVTINSRILEMVDQMFMEYSGTKIFCEACVVRHMLQLILSVGITNAEESRQFLFRLFARAYATAIVEHIKNLASVKERVLHNYTYWNEYKLFTKGIRTFDPTSMAIVKLFYYLDEAKLEETLSNLFDETLEGGYLCMDNSTPAMWVFSTGIASTVGGGEYFTSREIIKELFLDFYWT
ncbi:hypothetical protein Emed_005998 [Eimeria media]